MPRPRLWWKRAIIYQIYPRSFRDRSGDGLGDLQGIIEKLDYLRWLGIGAIWISPVFVSPHADGGYDIANYEAIDPIYGTMNDLDALVAAAHERDIRVILDLVPNHTSIEHPWFKESRASRDNPKADWYIWRDTPNDWIDPRGKRAWEWAEARQQYYYHAFLPQQPDLNWRNTDMQQAMFDVMRFWLDRDVDGFRVDLMWHLIKDPLFRDDPINPGYNPKHDDPGAELTPVFSSNQHEVHAIVHSMRKVLDEYDERLMIGEVYLPVAALMTYYGAHGTGAQLPFNFQLIRVPWNATAIAECVSKYEGELPRYAWPNWVLGNHDKPRIATRVGAERAAAAAVILLMFRGTPFMYYGDEIGMHDVDVPPDERQDPLGRDPQRTPMQWDASHAAGFTPGKPWLPVAHDFETMNVERERADPDSLLSLYRRLIDLRQSNDALLAGDYVPFVTGTDVLAWGRAIAGKTDFVIAVNLGNARAEFKTAAGTIAVCTKRSREGERIRTCIELEAGEAAVIRLS